MHLTQLPSGSWRVIVQTKGKKRTATAPTKELAKFAGAELVIEMGSEPDRHAMTLAELCEMHVQGSNLADTTREDYDAVLRKMPDWMKGWDIQAATVMMLEQAYRRLTVEGWSAHRVRKLHTVVHAAFERAVRWGWVKANPAHRAWLPTPERRELTVPTADVVVDFLTAIDAASPALGCAVRVAAASEIRRGELCGLQWSDIEWVKQEIRVQRAISTTTIAARKVKTIKTGTKGNRVLAVGPTTIAALKGHRAREVAAALERGVPLGPWVFTVDGVNPWRTDYPTAEVGKIRRAEIERATKEKRTPPAWTAIRAKELRHFGATDLIAAGVDPKTVAGRLGHSRVSTTLDIYAQWLPARDREAADIIEAKLSGRG